MAHRLILILLLSAGLTGCDRSGSDGAAAATSATPAGGAPPILTFDATTQDFGAIDETMEVATAFEFTNTGGSELVIEDVTAGCGCTTPRIAKRRYLPGERGRIDVGFDPTGPGQTTKYVTVQSNTDPAVTRLTIVADVTAFLMIEPKILQMGELQLGAEHEATMTVWSTDVNFVIDSVIADVPNVTARVVPEGWETAPGPKTVEVTVAPSAPWGGLYFGLDITATGRPTLDAEPVTHTRTVRAAGRVFGRLSADPDMFRFAVDTGEDFVREIRLKRADGRPLRILNTDVRVPALPGATLRAQPESLDTWVLTFSATAGPMPGRCPGTVVVTTDVPGEEVIELKTLGVIQAPR